MALRVWVGLFVALSLLVLSTTALPAAETQSDEHIQRILKLIGDKDRDFRAAGLEQVRSSARGPELTRVFAGELSKLDSEGQIALLDALADRGDVAARPAVLELVSASHDAAVRAAAIGALGRVGEAEDLPLLIKTATEGGKLERVAARDALTQFSGESVNKSLATALQSARPKAKEALIEILATRRASDQLPLLLAATVDKAAGVRRAAMNALGQIGRPDEIAQMLPGVLKAQKGGERDEAEKNVALVCERIDNEDQRGTALDRGAQHSRCGPARPVALAPGTCRRQEIAAFRGRDCHRNRMPLAGSSPSMPSASGPTRASRTNCSRSSAMPPIQPSERRRFAVT